jgi:5-formyltetrahydrofolate cyclo-ligase
MPLSFHVIPPGTALQKSAFGVLEPPADAPVIEPDLILVPLLGFDRRGYRLGYGQGHYDRTLMALRARRPVTAVGLAWACQEVDRIPADAFDQPLDWVVTDKEAIGPLR